MDVLGIDTGQLGTLAIYGFGIAAYTLAVAVLYVPMTHRMMFARRLGEQAVATAGRRFAYVLLFPLVSFLFFLIVGASLLFMGSFSDENTLETQDVLTIAMAVVLAIRITAYFSERAAEDLAKVMPLGLLGVVLVTNGLGDLQESLANLRAFGDEPALLGVYLGVIVVVEFLLRIVYEVLGRPKHKPVRGVTMQRRP